MKIVSEEERIELEWQSERKQAKLANIKEIDDYEQEMKGEEV